MKQVIRNLIKKINYTIVALIGKTPPKTIPITFLNDYTMDGKVKIKQWYLNNYYLSIFPRIFTKKYVNKFIEKVKQKSEESYGFTDKCLYQALDKYSIKDKDIAVIGTVEPFYESMALEYGAKQVTIIEYNKIISFHPKIKSLTYPQYNKNPQQFDIAFSISTFEHDGLGRYGDKLNPNGDLEAMQKMKSIVKPGGLLFLAVPIGKDTLFWNAHRMYGKHRLPLLFKGWKIVDGFGFNKQQLEKDREKQEQYDQPIFVLQNI